MSKKRYVMCVASVVSIALVAGACQSYGGSAALGSGIGAGLGAIIGNQSGHAGEGALIGAVVGGMAGLIVKDIQVRRTRTAAQTVDQYDYEPSQGKKVIYENGAVTPNPAKPGQEVAASMQYAVLGGQDVQVEEVRTLQTPDGKQVQLAKSDFTRSDGTYESKLPFKVPANAAPGTYHVAQTVTIPNVPNATDSQQIAFTISN